MTKKKAVKKLIIFLVICGLLCFVALKAKTIIQLSNEKSKLLEEQQNLIQQKENLQLELDNISTEEYIENLARRDLKLIKKDELLYIISGESDKDEKQ